MNTPTLTDRELKELACLEISHLYTAVVSIKADDGRTYLFATSQYLDGVHEANPSREADGARERLVLRFTTGEVVVLGSQLERIGQKLAEGQLLCLKPAQPRYAHLVKCPRILSILVKQKEAL